MWTHLHREGPDREDRNPLHLSQVCNALHGRGPAQHAMSANNQQVYATKCMQMRGRCTHKLRLNGLWFRVAAAATGKETAQLPAQSAGRVVALEDAALGQRAAVALGQHRALLCQLHLLTELLQVHASVFLPAVLTSQG